MVLPMVWVDSLKFFCVFSETLTNVENALVHTSLPVPEYRDITKIPKTSLSPPHTLDILTHSEFCINVVRKAVQGGGRTTTPSLQRHCMGPQVALKRLVECKESQRGVG